MSVTVLVMALAVSVEPFRNCCGGPYPVSQLLSGLDYVMNHRDESSPATTA
jgi:hypothetical protein